MRTKGRAVNSKKSAMGIMLIQRKTAGVPIAPANPGCPGHPGGRRPARHRPPRAGVIAAVLAAGCAAGCAGGHATARHAAAVRPPGLTAPAVPQAGSLVRVPHPGYSSPASVAAAFYVAWGSTDAIHDGPDAYAARCAPMVTAPLEQQLTASQPATTAWQDLHREQMVSLVQVRAVIRPAGAPLPTLQVVYLRVYATRVTTSTTGRTVSSDGITLRLARSGGRWLVSAVLFY
jgi:hypothetical protein